MNTSVRFLRLRRSSRTALGSAVAVMAAVATQAAVCTWTGAGASSNASEAANWSPAAPTGSADEVVLNGTAAKSMLWDLTNPIASWFQDATYGGTVTVQTAYSGAFTSLVIAGDCTINGGTWTHEANGATEASRLRVHVAGSFALGSGAALNAQGKGYAAAKGPGAGSSAVANGQPAASHGGMGAAAFSNTYGSIVAPTSLGSGAYSAGGGAIWLTVGGTAAIDGRITAQPAQPTLAGGSGGSILIEAAAFAGGTNGLLDASVPYSASGSGQRGAGGGRIAVKLSAGSSFGSVRMKASGGQTADGIFGAAGTIYRQTAGQAEGAGTLMIDNAGIPSLAQTLVTPAQSDLNGFAEIVITNQGVLGLNTNTAFNLGHPTNLTTYGPAQSFVAAPRTNGLAIGDDWTLSGFTLRLYTNLHLAGSLAVTNAMLEMYAGWQPGVRVDGQVLVATNGVISHAPNGTAEVYRLAMEVGGDLTVAAGGAIDVTGKGYAKSSGPGRGNGSNNNSLPGASHGGLAAEWTSPWAYWVTYGSVTAPTNLGSGGLGAAFNSGITRGGGGAAEIRVGGATHLAGSILAKGYPSGGLAGNAGGSVFLTTGTLDGNGTIDASANPTTQYGGGGGRIAVILTGSDSFGGVTMRAFGAGTYRGAAGTIYRETAGAGAGRGVATVQGDASTYTTSTVTWIPAPTNATADIGLLAGVTLNATNHANVALATDLTIGDLFLRDSTVRLRLKGYTLRLHEMRHEDWGREAWVVYDGGQIVWDSRGTVIKVR